MFMGIKMRTEFGEVEITHELIAAIELITDAAWTLQITTGEFMAEFGMGVPKCPCCEEEEKTH